MTTLVLAKGNGSDRLGLRLPVSASEFRNAYSTINSSEGKGLVRIDRAASPVWNLGGYLSHEDISDPDVREKLNTLAERIDGMSESDQKKFACVLDARSINGLDDVLTAADALGEYSYHPEITTERELGVYLVENHVLDFPEKTWPYLDYRAIGIEYHADHSGALTPKGYVVRRSEAPQEKQEKKPVFRVLLWSESMRNASVEPIPLDLPASPLKLQQVRRSIDEPFETVDIVQAECLNAALREQLSMEYPDVEIMQALGQKVQEFQTSPNEMNKFLAVLEVEQPEALTDALDLAINIDTYSLLPDDAEAFGQEALKLNFPSVDDDLIDELDGFTDWDAYGRYMMEADGVRITKYGFLRREGNPFPDESMGQQMG